MPHSAPLTVVVGDDDDAFREALVDLLSADERFEVVGSTASGTQVRRLSAGLQPDLVLIDVRMDGGGAGLAMALGAKPQILIKHLLPGREMQGGGLSDDAIQVEDGCFKRKVRPRARCIDVSDHGNAAICDRSELAISRCNWSWRIDSRKEFCGRVVSTRFELR